MATIKQLGNEIHANAKDKGFWNKDRNLGEILMLIVSEVSEAMEADRKDRFTSGSIKAINGWKGDEDFKRSFTKYVKDSFEDELADVCIRVFDLAHSRNIDLEAHIKAKMRFNATREKMHGKKY